MSHSFRKPPPGKVTSCLFVGNCCPQAVENILSYLPKFETTPKVILPDKENAFYIFILFDSPQDATLGMETLSSLPGQVPSSKKFNCAFAELCDHKVNSFRHVSLTSEECKIPGLYLIENYVSEAEERSLLSQIDQQDWVHLAKRRVQHYGYEFKYETRNVDTSRCLGSLPLWLQGLAARVGALEEVNQEVDQMTMNEYEPGVGLSAHIDTHSAFSGAICSLSLAGATVMEMRRGEDHRPLLLPRRSLLIMSGESRYAWQHYIPHRKADMVNGTLVPRPARRVSITLRRVRPAGTPCTCAWPQHCDNQGAELPPTRIATLSVSPAAESNAEAGRVSTQAEGESALPPSPAPARAPEAAASELGLRVLEEEHVHRVYDAIARHFSATRFAVWPAVRSFIMSLTPGAVVADVGCGNGKYFAVRRDIAVIASDRSSGLVAVAAERAGAGPGSLQPLDAPRAADVFIADALNLPLRPGCASAALCIAVLHHVASAERRIRLIRSLLQILQPGGRALITVWSTQQEEPHKTIDKWQRMTPGTVVAKVDDSGDVHADALDHMGADYFVPWHVPFHRADAARHVQPTSDVASEANKPGSAICIASKLNSTSGSSAEIVENSCNETTLGETSSQTIGSNELTSSLPPADMTLAPNKCEGQAFHTSKKGSRKPSHATIDNAKGAVVFQRYIHLYDEGELEMLVREAGGEVESSFYDRSNWCVIVHKP